MRYICEELPDGPPPGLGQLFMEGPKANGNPGFDFGKALKGNNGASRPAHTGRGDGKFADGSLLAVKDGVCTIAPSAFDGENVAETLERLRHMGAFGSSASETSTADTSSSLQSRGGYKKGAFCEATTSKPAPSAGEPVSISDLGVEMDRVLSSLGSRSRALDTSHDFDIDTSGAAAPCSYGRDTSGDNKLPAPESTMRLKRQQSGGSEVVELSVLLPGVESVSLVDVVTLATEVRVFVPGKYRLEVQLPKRVSPTRAEAKWVQRKSKLVLTLPID